MKAEELVVQYKEIATLLACFGVMFISRLGYKLGRWCWGELIHDSFKYAVRNAVIESDVYPVPCRSYAERNEKKIGEIHNFLFGLIQHLDLKGRDPAMIKQWAYMKRGDGQTVPSFGWSNKTANEYVDKNYVRLPWLDDHYDRPQPTREASDDR